MSQWADQVENHQLQELLQVSQTLLNQAAELLENDTQALEALERLRSVIGLVIRVLFNVDPEVVPVQPLSNMVPHLTNLNKEVQSFVSNQNVAHLTNANKHAENILPQIAAIPVLATPDDVDGMREAFTSFRRSAGQLIHNLEQEASNFRDEMDQDRLTSSQNIESSKEQLVELETELERIQAEIQSQKGRLDTAIAEFQNQFSKKQDVRQEQFAEAEKERNDANKKTIVEQEEQFSTVKENHKEKFAGICEAADEKLISFQTSSEKTVQSYIEALDEYKTQAETLVHVIGNTGMVGGYQKTANTARNTARFWQCIAIGAFAGLIWFAIKVFSATQSPDFTWSIFAGRVFVAGTFGIAAAYASRLSDRHEEIERYNRRVELELASIDPYLVGIQKDKQESVKEELAKRMFGQKPVPKKQSKVSGTNADILNLLREMVTELIKKSG